MRNTTHICVAGIMGLAVVFAAMLAGTPVGVADNPQPPQWEVATATLDRPEPPAASPSDERLSSYQQLDARLTKLENRVANLERNGLDSFKPTPAAVPPTPIVSTEPWQTFEVIDATPTPMVYEFKPVEITGQFRQTTTITTEQCSGGVCRPQATPVRRFFRR